MSGLPYQSRLFCTYGWFHSWGDWHSITSEVQRRWCRKCGQAQYRPYLKMDCVAAAAEIEQLRSGHTDPISMLLYCPQCGLQHIDEPDERTPDWTNPPHRSHLCHECGCIWRPADVPTEGVASIETVGKADTWTPDKSTARAALLDEAVVDLAKARGSENGRS